MNLGKKKPSVRGVPGPFNLAASAPGPVVMLGPTPDPGAPQPHPKNPELHRWQTPHVTAVTAHGEKAATWKGRVKPPGGPAQRLCVTCKWIPCSDSGRTLRYLTASTHIAPNLEEPKTLVLPASWATDAPMPSHTIPDATCYSPGPLRGLPTQPPSSLADSQGPHLLAGGGCVLVLSALSAPGGEETSKDKQPWEDAHLPIRPPASLGSTHDRSLGCRSSRKETLCSRELTV